MTISTEYGRAAAHPPSRSRKTHRLPTGVGLALGALVSLAMWAAIVALAVSLFT